ncbi:MAG: hypothetical protein ACJAWV_003653 [Flammeovirgaceae bacterium]|jgi:hypothetical protein
MTELEQSHLKLLNNYEQLLNKHEVQGRELQSYKYAFAKLPQTAAPNYSCACLNQICS